jgi:DNA (cytosine-5)-methyltransferase 1
MVEIDPFCQKVLQKNFPGVPIHDNIKTFTYNGTNPFILTGGFPCQPFSCAGKRKGKEDDRYLWPEMLRVISEARPTWVIGENVGGFVNMGLDDCISDLEAEGYEVQPFIIPACAKNAPHRRDRVWIVANTKSNDGNFSCLQNNGDKTFSKKFRRCFRNESMPKLCRVDDGIPSELDRLKSLGNAIVPQIAYEIMKGILEAEGIKWHNAS